MHFLEITNSRNIAQLLKHSNRAHMCDNWGYLIIKTYFDIDNDLEIIELLSIVILVRGYNWEGLELPTSISVVQILTSFRDTHMYLQKRYIRKGILKFSKKRKFPKRHHYSDGVLLCCCFLHVMFEQFVLCLT